jgi:hypothetical protein
LSPITNRQSSIIRQSSILNRESIVDRQSRIHNDVLYYTGRFLQLVGMSLLAASILADYGLGPSPRFFVAGIALFIAGWAAAKRRPLR